MADHDNLVHKAEKDLNTTLKGVNHNFPKILSALTRYRTACEYALIHDCNSATGNVVENKLWDIHGKINAIFRKQLQQFTKPGGEKRPVELRKMRKFFLDFIKSSQRFYRGYVQKSQTQFGEIPQLKTTANEAVSPSSSSVQTQTCGQPSHAVLLSCHATLIRLGDLSRWRETQAVLKDRDWGDAIKYYDLARTVYAASGASHSQLAVIALADGDDLRIIYHLYRALTVDEPHPNAQGNLEREFKKVLSLMKKEKLPAGIDAGSAPADGNFLTQQYCCLHAKCYIGGPSTEIDDLESNVMDELKEFLIQPFTEEILLQIVLTNIAAEYFAGLRLRANIESVQIRQSFLDLQRVNVRTLLTLLESLWMQSRSGTKNDQHEDDTEAAPSKLTISIHRFLPSLKYYSAWLRSNVRLLTARADDSRYLVHLKRLWKVYADTLTLLVSEFPVSKLKQVPPIEYMLEEDGDTLDFKPFDSDYMRSRYYLENTSIKKPRWYDGGIHRHSRGVETSKRILDFVIDGVFLAQQNIPVQLNGDRTFIHADDGASSDASVVSRPAPLVDITHVDETVFAGKSTATTEARSYTSSDDLSTKVAGTRAVDAPESSVAQEDIDGRITEPRQEVSHFTDETSNETSYGVIGSATAKAIGDVEDQHRLPSQSDARVPSSGPNAEERSAPRRAPLSLQDESMIPEHRKTYDVVSSLGSSMPDPTNHDPPRHRVYSNQPLMEAKFPTKTNYTTGKPNSAVCGRNTHDAQVDPTSTPFTPEEYGNSGRVLMHTPPNGQDTA